MFCLKFLYVLLDTYDVGLFTDVGLFIIKRRAPMHIRTHHANQNAKLQFFFRIKSKK